MDQDLIDFLEAIRNNENVDLGTLFGGPTRIDLNDRFALLNRYDQEVNVVHGFDGLYDEWETPPIIADEKAGGILYVLMTSGYFHKVKLEALGQGDYYHVRFCEATMNYQGQQS